MGNLECCMGSTLFHKMWGPRMDELTFVVSPTEINVMIGGRFTTADNTWSTQTSLGIYKSKQTDLTDYPPNILCWRHHRST